MSTEDGSPIETPEDLAAALRIAAELEHGLCCQYLFAGFTLRRTLEDFADLPGLSEDDKLHVMALTQAWATQIMLVARQEMEHLAIVINLQTALGQPPHLARPDFPVPRRTYPIDAHFCLERVDATTLDRFLYYERPDYLAKEVEFDDPGCCGKTLQLTEPLKLESHGGLELESLQDLYEQIAAAYNGPRQLPAAALFQGSAAAQVQSAAVQWSSRVSVPQVTNRAQAALAIAQIVFEGEGIGELPTSPNSHFARFVGVKQDFQELGRALPAADPALPVMCNPAIGSDIPDGATRITDAAAVKAMQLFDDGYRLMLAMLRGFFETYQGNFGTFPTFAGAAPNSALFLEAFYPFMTMFIRPLGELICRLPAGPEHPGKNAGPAFALHGEQPPCMQDLDWYADRLAALDRDSQALRTFLADHEAMYGPAAVQTAERQWQVLRRMRLNLPRLWKEGALNP
jgi:hypothetical protein